MSKQHVIYTLHNSFPNLLREAVVQVLKAPAFSTFIKQQPNVHVVHIIVFMQPREQEPPYPSPLRDGLGGA
jgi:hypothetical protein